MENDQNKDPGQDKSGKRPPQGTNDKISKNDAQDQVNKKDGRSDMNYEGKSAEDTKTINRARGNSPQSFDHFDTNNGHIADRLKERDRIIAEERQSFDNIADRQENFSDRSYYNTGKKVKDAENKSEPPAGERNYGIEGQGNEQSVNIDNSQNAEKGERNYGDGEDTLNKASTSKPREKKKGNDDSPLTGNNKSKEEDENRPL
jgi:hypothetical protein